jgi:spermidine synthase
MRREPITYYVRSGPFGDLFRALSPAQLGRPVAVVGLGVGSLGCYGQRGQDWTFYEIDPLVERLANNEKFFTFMRDCPPEKRVVLGDARLSLRAAADGTYGLIFMDAFASDAIPVHLMTREALALYLAKLTPDGLIVFNISHRVMDLAPIIGRLAADAGVVARIVRHRQLRGEFEQTYGYTVDIAVLTRDPANLGALANDPRWELLPIRREDRVWTDDYSNPLSAIKLF